MISFVLTNVLGRISQNLGSILGGIFALAVLVPSLAVDWRRMHDIGRPGWHSLVALIPLVGWIIAIIWCAKEGDKGENAYGPDPKA